jgi:hypothetical protein
MTKISPLACVTTALWIPSTDHPFSDQGIDGGVKTLALSEGDFWHLNHPKTITRFVGVQCVAPTVGDLKRK